MHEPRGSSFERDTSERRAFETIDDLVAKTEELLAALKKLSETKHPLAIRRGVRKEVDIMTNNNEDSAQIKAGSRTYFFDIKTTRDGKPYLVITESKFKGEGVDRERNVIMVFPENAREFADAVSQMVAKLQ